MKPDNVARVFVIFSLLGLATVAASGDTVATAVYSRIGNGYQREPRQAGGFKPEYYALSNGGKIYGTTRDETVDRVSYAEVAGIATRLLAQQNYHYAQTKGQAKLLLVLQWGTTIAPNRTNYEHSMADASAAYADLARAMGPQGMGSVEQVRGAADAFAPEGTGEAAVAKDRFESQMLRLMLDNSVRDRVNDLNARVLGYSDDLHDSSDIRRWAGGGDRYTDLIADVEETRYYIVISAYDFPELERSGTKKLLWQTRVSVRSPGNTFDNSVVAMLKSASNYFGQNTSRLMRDEQTKGTVELGDTKFLGEAKQQESDPARPQTPGKDQK